MKHSAFFLWRKNQRWKAGCFFIAIVFFSPALFSKPVQKQSPRPDSVYRALPVQKSLASSPRFVLIDDFTSTEWKNQRGGIWHLRKASAYQVQVSRAKEDARNPKFGFSLKLNFNIPKEHDMAFKSSLDKLDVSQAEGVVFSCKFIRDNPKEFSGSLRFVLEDWRAKQTVIDITAQCSDKGWNEIILQRARFSNLDWDQLNTISFVLVSAGKKAKGSLQIDEIAFYGDNEVSFESHRDNLKGFPKTVFSEKRRSELLGIKDDRQLMREIAVDTWKYFENAENKEQLMVVDHLRLGDAPLAADYTSPTNMAMDLISVVAAEKMKLISRADALAVLSNKLQTIEKMRRWKNLYYNFYETNKLSVTRGFISTVDNGWLGIAFVVVRQAMDKILYREATKILNRMDFSEFLDFENNQLSLGFDSEKNELISTHYGMLVSEARATSLLGIGKGDLPEDHWWSLYRTPPTSWVWQSQKPEGREMTRGEINYFQGYYRYGDMKIVPSWGGSLFEFLMPTLVLNEKENARKSFGANNINAVKAHKDYALHKQGYPVWGLSPTATTNGRTWKYGEYGVKAIGVKGYPDRGVVTPHVSFLALNVAPEDAIQNIRKMLEIKMYGEYGFYDSVQVKDKRVNTQYLALDQGMTFIAIANFLEDNFIQKLFEQDAIGQKAAKLWAEEKFFDDGK